MAADIFIVAYGEETPVALPLHIGLVFIVQQLDKYNKSLNEWFVL